MSGAGKFTAHGSVKPDAIRFTEHSEKAANAAFSVSDYWGFTESHGGMCDPPWTHSTDIIILVSKNRQTARDGIYMTQLEYNELLALYRARLDIASQRGTYASMLQSILRDISNKVKRGELTKEQGLSLAKILFNISVEQYHIDGVESLNEEIRKGSLDISYDAADAMAEKIAAMKANR